MTETQFSGRWKRSLPSHWREGFIPWVFERNGKRLFKPATRQQIDVLRSAGRLIWVRAGNRAHTYIATFMDDTPCHRATSKVQLWEFLFVWVHQSIRNLKYMHEKVDPLPPKKQRKKRTLAALHARKKAKEAKDASKPKMSSV